MGLIYTKDSDIKPQDLTLDFYLEATPLRSPREKVNMTGIGTYKIGPYLDNLGYGITSVEIDVKPNLQPVISITFKDLYGNLIFNRNQTFGYDVLFQLPYPKFRLYVKGYLGKPVSFLLQVKSVKTNYQPSDGSYELKAEFVPNVFGFFNDIPYQYLFTVSGLKKLMDGDSTSPSIVDIAKNGAEISLKIQQAEDKYSSIRSKLNDFNQNASGVYNSYKDNKLNFDGIVGDEDLNANGFKAIKFNLDVNGSNGKPFIPTDQTVFDVYGDAIIASINSPNKIEFKKDVKEISNFLQSNEGKKQIEAGKKIIKDNLDAITKSAGKKVFTTEEAKIDTQSIYNVMTRLAGDCAYVLGYILEGGISGYNGEPSRSENEKIFGNYYPLIENENISGGASMGEQVPYPAAKKEIEHVERFVKALYEGIQYVEKVTEELQPKEPEAETPDPGGGFEKPLNKKLGNVETFKSSPYTAKADNIIVNMIQRAGLLGCGYGGSQIADSAGSMYTAFTDGEIENLKDSVNELKDTEKATLRTFCKVIGESFSSNGTPKIKWDDKTSANVTLRQYLGGYFSKFPNASSEPQQFLDKKPTSLASLYTYHNSVLYHSPQNLVNALKLAAGNNGGANNILTSGTNPEVLCYFSAGDGPIPDDNPFKSTSSLINSDNSPDFDVSTADRVPFKDPYYQWFKATAFTSDEVQKTVFIDYTKLLGTLNQAGNSYNSTYFNPDQMIVKHSKSGNAGAKPQKEDVIFRLLDWKTTKAPSSYVVNMANKYTASLLFYWTSKLLDKNKTYLSLTDAEIKKQKAAEAKLNAATNNNVGGTPEVTVEDTGPKPYTRDEQQIRAIYVQFHHICQAWISLSNIENPTEDTLPTGTNVNLRLPLEKAYRNTDPSSSFYLNFNFPLVSEYDPKIDIRNAIVNTDSLLENNSQTSTLNMMQNICQVNNFLLQPIPGGLTSDLDDLFKPRPQLEYAVGQNALSIIWAPTPENRFTKNNNDPVYPINGFLDKLNSINQPIMVLKYGDPNNVVVKSIKAGTDDNKVTSESLIATDAIVNNQNQNKKKGFDCSMLAVMQGRSYKISLDLMGNAQIFPTMYLAVDGLPIFTGLYWVTEVVHKITPNNMETTVDAIKMKYNGDGKFTAVLPILKRTESSFVTSSNSSYTNAFGSDLCMEFITKIKDQKFKNTTELNAFVKKYTNDKYSDFPTFFNKEVKGQTQFAESEINAGNWTKAWDAIIPIVWADYGTAGINMLEFIAIHAIIYNEVGGKYESIREYMDENKTGAPHPGIAKAFDKTDKKTSYNSGEGPKGTQKDLNKTAFELFNDVNYISAHGSLKFGNDPNVLKTTNQAWKGSEFPKSLFANNLLDATATGPSTFINEADFYKFSGRGFIQNTWRVSYKKIVGFILTYTGNDTIIKKYRDTWKGQGFNSNEEVILTKSTNANWDELFTSYELCGYAIKLHASDSKYQYITDLSKSKEDLVKAINKVADKVSGSKDDYRQKHQARVFSIINKMLPSCAQTIQDINVTGEINKVNLDNTPVGALIDGPTLKNKQGQVLTHKCTVVKRGNTTVAIHTGNEPQFSKREVRSITLHITDGWGYAGCAARTVDGVGNCDPPVFKNGKQVSGVRFNTGGIHYAVDWTGARATGIPELISSVHGNYWNTHGIGIEICLLFGVKSKGPAGPQQVVTYSNGATAPVGKASYGGTPNPGYVTLDYKYCGYNEFMEFTDVQITAVYNLCVEILGRYPKIKEAIQGKTPYAVWGWTGKPAAGSNVVATRLDTSMYGIYGHCTSPGASHVDPPPTPKMIAMLKKLGMTG